jgi:hypothetical protein
VGGGKFPISPKDFRTLAGTVVRSCRSTLTEGNSSHGGYHQLKYALYSIVGIEVLRLFQEECLPTLTIDIPEVMVRRLEALASASGRSAEELAREGIDSLTASFQSRRAILKSRRDAAKSAGTNYSLADFG